MLMMLNLIVGTVSKHLRNQRGVVSVEWLILAIVIMVAIVAAFAPSFGNALSAAVTQIGTILSGAQTAAAS